jgi:drug/metabolite transporter (DMT)-like permease
LAGKGDRLKADLLMIFVAAIWGAGFVAQRAGSQYVGYFIFGAARYILGFLVVLPFVRKFNIPRNLLPWTILTGVVLFLGSALQQAGITSTTAGNAAFITGLYVVLVPILMAVFTKKPAPVVTWISALMAVIGTLFLSTGGAIALASGDALELAGAFMWALHLILVSKFSPKINTMQFALIQFFVAGVLNLLFGLIFEYQTIGGLSQAWIAIVYAGAVSTAIGFTGQVWGQRHAPAVDAALILSMEAVFAAISGYLFLFERFSPVQILGCGLIFSAVILSQLWPIIKEKNKQPSHP